MDKKELEVLQQKVVRLRAEGKYKETIEVGYELLEHGLRLNDYKSMLTAYIHNAISFYCIGDIEKTFQSISAYQEICSQRGDDDDWLSLYNVSFFVYEMRKDTDKAKATLWKSIDLGKKLGRYNIVSNAYSNMSHVYMVEEDYENAWKMAKLGIEMAMLHTPRSEILELRVKLNLAKSYIGMSDLEISKALIDEIMQSSLLHSFVREKSQCYDLQGIWYAKQQQYKEAFNSFTTAKELVEGYNDVYLLKTIQEERCKLCELMGDVELGYVVQKEYIALLKEISDRKFALEALRLDVKHSLSMMEKKANIDSLTGVYSRSYVEGIANDWLKQASITGESIVCIVFDMDNFKAYNDEYGHLFGDEMIKLVGKVGVSILGNDEIIGRYGGDEFIMLLKDASLEYGMKKAEQLKAALQKITVDKEDKAITIQVSVGVSDNVSGRVALFEELFHVADTALYRAKNSGKNRICASV